MENKIIKKVILINGMTCVNCERNVENGLKKLDGIMEVKASFVRSRVDVTYQQSTVDLDTIYGTIESLDYTVLQGQGSIGAEKKTKNAIIVNRRIALAGVILSCYILIKYTIGFNFVPEVNESMGYSLLFVVGLLTSVHCIAMCGGINLSQCISKGYSSNTKIGLAQLKPSFFYNMGRVVSYTIIGGIIGAFGAVVSFSGFTKGMIALIAGVFMIIMGLNMTNAVPWLRRFNVSMPRFLGAKIRKKAGNKGPFIVGLMNGLMPCGPLQTMQIYALGTGSFVAGALSMFFFSLGTVPLMFGFGAISSLLSRKFTKDMLFVSSMIVVLLGFLMAGRGLNLAGFAIPTSAGSIEREYSDIAVIEEDIQIVKTKLTDGQYSPIVVQKGVPVQWIIEVEPGDLNGCNNPVTIPKYNIVKKLDIGENVINFTPSEEGPVVYTCWMGMISSTIEVVTDVNSGIK